MALKLKDENEIKTPEVLYEIVVDYGEYGTMTVFSSSDEREASCVLRKLLNGDCSDTDIDEDQLEYIEGVSLKQTIEAPADNVEIVTFGNTQQVMVELYSAKVDK